MSLKRHSAGMSIVEMMVAIVISLLGVLVIFQVFAVNEDTRRTTTSSSDEQTSGLLALLQVERELRSAGAGINDFGLLGCSMQIYDNQRSPNFPAVYAPGANPPPLAPVQIVSGAGANPDIIRVIYGSTTQAVGSVPLGTGMASVTDDVTLSYVFGFNAGDVFVIGQPGANCTLGEVTGIQTLINVQHGNASYVDTVTDTAQTPRFNNPAGFPVAYGYQVGKVLNLGQSPALDEIAVDVNDPNPSKNMKLNISNLWGTNTPQAVAEQIVGMKAQYGMDDGTNNGTITARATYTADDNLVDNYTSTSPTTQQGWQRVRAVRLAVVSRSLTAFKPNSGTVCDATVPWGNPLYPVRWAYGPDAPSGQPIDIRVTADWQCYKYRVYETVVPLRNVYWRQP